MVQAADFRGDFVERVTGIEPALSACEPVFLHRLITHVCNVFRLRRNLRVEHTWNTGWRRTAPRG